MIGNSILTKYYAVFDYTNLEDPDEQTLTLGIAPLNQTNNLFEKQVTYTPNQSNFRIQMSLVMTLGLMVVLVAIGYLVYRTCIYWQFRSKTNQLAKKLSLLTVKANKKAISKYL